ncbi:Phosphate regulon sensor protein PhoR [Tsuneonella dongtanensis]|uniref:histidine kinase n=1 Tax=Tsuneonella dongtanensis TaxID=692370 RepID=A0A1B2AES3_9SPHN|nr:ATP-binding protein [Tsuneonella dongtanensis]ANY20588.1 Phosphate regulon sensor protein PhoR [Tsuneonella dongtanensis]
MEPRRNLPWLGIALAVLGAIGLLILGEQPWLALAVLLLWVGSLWLAIAEPPPVQPANGGPRFSRDTMGELIEHSGTPLLLTEKGRIVIANQAAREVLGAHIVDQDVRVALRHPDAIALAQLDRAETRTVKGLARRHDIWRVSRQPLGDGMAVIELINRTAEADISRSHTDFVANASHELRTPLASIIGYAETLAEENGGADPAMREKFLGTILRESKRLKGLVDDLMSLSRIEAEKHDQPSERIDLKPLVDRAARDAAGAERITRVELELEDGLVVRGDQQQLEQLVRNLVDNALKYGAEDRPVHVTLVHGQGDNARFTVRDEGDGIAPEHLPHLTRRFYRTDPGRSRASGGTGLGLAIVKHIVERHRGRLDIDSKVGTGTTVEVRIPLSSDGEQELS